MKFALAALLSVAASASPFAPKSANNAKANYVNKLLRSAKTVRKLNEEYPVDISEYNVKFEKCQFVRSFNDEVAENEESPTVLGVTRFAIIRLCPGDCDNCNYNYGEYLLNLQDYLEVAVEYFQQEQEEMCDTCQQWCQFDDERRRLNDQQMPDDLDCDQCVEECQKIENMEENGFIDATEYLECQAIEDAYGNEYFAAPICTSGGDKIKIGLFSDEECSEYISDTSPDDILGVDDNGNNIALSHALLKQTYQETCVSCLEPDEDQNNNNDNNNNNGNNNDAQDADNVNEFCENIYNFAGKCEYSHGFDKGYYGVAGYENQWAQEDIVCQFIQSLKSGTYDEAGEINLSGASFSIGGGSSTTGGQKFALTFFIVGTVALAVYAAMLHSKLTKGTTMEAGSGALA